MSEIDIVQKITNLVSKANPDNLGDVLSEALEDYLKIEDPVIRDKAEEHLAELRFTASGAYIGWKLFVSPVMPNRVLSDLEILQLVGIERALHEMSYGFEMVEKSADEGWGGSSRTRFYLNSLYHYISSLFLIDTSKNTHRGLPMGGTIIKAMNPLGLFQILEPVHGVLQRSLGGKLKFGEAILMQRHSYLVHGDFSPERVEYLVSDTQMRDPTQQFIFREHMWDLFYNIVLFRLRILSILTEMEFEFDEVVSRYLQSVSKS